MKTIKKIAVAAAIMLAGSGVFAQLYSGDVQLQIGWQGATTTAGIPVVNDEYKFQSNSFYVGAENWNLFNINEMFSVGFFEKIAGGFGAVANMTEGQTTVSAEITSRYQRAAFEMLVGPALGIRVGDVAKLQVGAGLMMGISGIAGKQLGDVSISNAYKTNDSTTVGLAGFGLDVQAKFIPRSVVSPLVGFKYAFKGASEYDLALVEVRNSTVNIQKPFMEHTYSIYAGVSFNWGAR